MYDMYPGRSDLAAFPRTSGARPVVEYGMLVALIAAVPPRGSSPPSGSPRLNYAVHDPSRTPFR